MVFDNENNPRLCIKNNRNIKEQHMEMLQYIKRLQNTESIVGDVGLALVGNKTGDQIKWDFGSGEKNFEIIKVERFQN